MSRRRRRSGKRRDGSTARRGLTGLSNSCSELFCAERVAVRSRRAVLVESRSRSAAGRSAHRSLGFWPHRPQSIYYTQHPIRLRPRVLPLPCYRIARPPPLFVSQGLPLVLPAQQAPTPTTKVAQSCYYALPAASFLLSGAPERGPGPRPVLASLLSSRPVCPLQAIARRARRFYECHMPGRSIRRLTQSYTRPAKRPL